MRLIILFICVCFVICCNNQKEQSIKVPNEFCDSPVSLNMDLMNIFKIIDLKEEDYRGYFIHVNNKYFDYLTFNKIELGKVTGIMLERTNNILSIETDSNILDIFTILKKNHGNRFNIYGRNIFKNNYYIPTITWEKNGSFVYFTFLPSKLYFKYINDNNLKNRKIIDTRILLRYRNSKDEYTKPMNFTNEIFGFELLN